MNLLTICKEFLYRPMVVGEAAKINFTEDIDKIADGTDPLEIEKAKRDWTPGSYILRLPEKDTWSIVTAEFFETYFTFTDNPTPGELTPCKQIRAIFK